MHVKSVRQLFENTETGISYSVAVSNKEVLRSLLILGKEKVDLDKNSGTNFSYEKKPSNLVILKNELKDLKIASKLHESKVTLNSWRKTRAKSLPGPVE